MQIVIDHGHHTVPKNPFARPPWLDRVYWSRLFALGVNLILWMAIIDLGARLARVI